MRGAKPEREIERPLLACIRKGERLLVACSGGPDSVALAGLLADLRVHLQLTLTLGHVHHGRRASAWQDEAVVLRVGALFDLPVLVAGLAPMGAGNEAALRHARYRALGQLAANCGAKSIATAHTAEDQTETVLLALFRGTGLRGLRGMPERRPLSPGLTLVRPLLRVERSSLRKYCHRRTLPYALDPSNADLGLRRNAVRAALESLREVFPQLDRAVSRAAEIVRHEAAGANRAALRRRILAALRERDSLGEVSFKHIEAAVNALENGRSGHFFMGSDVELEIGGGQLLLRSVP